MTDTLFEWFCWGVLALMGGALLYAAFHETTSEKLELPKREWRCTETRTSSTVVPAVIGKMILPMVVPSETCVRYERV